jgi:hypothetical protein
MDGIRLSGQMESRKNPAKRPEETQKAACGEFFLRFRGSRGRGQGHFADFFLKAAAQVPASNSLEFFEREIRHAKPLHSWRIPRATEPMFHFLNLVQKACQPGTMKGGQTISGA